MSDKNACACGAAPKLIFACSGAADVGAVADQAARRLTKDGAGKMFCLAGVGGRVSGIMATTESAARILAIDGCPLNCVKSCLEQAGFKKYGTCNWRIWVWKKARRRRLPKPLRRQQRLGPRSWRANRRKARHT